VPYTRQHGIVSEKKYVDDDGLARLLQGGKVGCFLGWALTEASHDVSGDVILTRKQRPSKCISADP
jgi:hypothetical protein